METAVFYILAGIILAFSFLTVSTNNILRAAVYLLFVLGATAGIYFMMNFNFLAAVQLTVYAGGIVVLIIFSILLTHQINTQLELSTMRKRMLSMILASAAGLVLLYGILTYPFEINSGTSIDASMNVIGKALMSYDVNGYVLPFEVISVLLLACMVAAIIIAKKFSHD